MFKKLFLVMVAALILGCKPPIDNSNERKVTTSDIYFENIRSIDPSTNSLESSDGWYNESSFYHVWVNAFKDASTGSLHGDGIGDMVGLTEAITGDYFEKLGINALWLSPFFKGKADSPSGNMHLYDTIDHYEVQSQFGTVENVKKMLAAAHAKGIRVIFDFVPNHVSNEHPWFKGSVQKDGKHDDWFNWKSSKPAGWTGFDSNSDWHYNYTRKEYYYGVFWDGMPDLNYNNPDVRKAMADVVIYWLNLGFDGIRVDAVKYMFEDFTDDSTWKDNSDNIALFQEFRSLLDQYSPKGYSKMMIAENWDTDIDNINLYGGTTSKLAFNMSFDFRGANAIADIVKYRYTSIASNYITEPDKYPLIKLGSFLSNHDEVVARPASLYDENISKQKIAAVYNTLTSRVPFLYYGNEIGATGITSNTGGTGGDINLRQDLDWDEVTSQNGDSNSLLEWYRAIGQIRNKYINLFQDTPTVLTNNPTKGDVVSYGVQKNGENILIVINHNSQSQDITVDLTGLTSYTGSWTTILGTDGFTTDGKDFTITNMTASSVRIYYMGLDLIENPMNDTYVPDAIYDSSFIRGEVAGSSGWDSGNGLSMINSSDNIWYKDITLAAGTYEFKFARSNTNWTDPSYPTIGYGNYHTTELESGTYRFQFNWDTKELSLIKL